MKKKQQEVKFYSKEIKKSRELNDDDKKVVTFFILLVIILGLGVLLYIFNANYVTKDGKGSETTTTEAVQYDDSKLTINTMFNVEKDEYYVLIFNSNNKTENALYAPLTTSFKEDKIPLYSVDLANAMNKKYYNPKGNENKKPLTPNEVVITKPTLITFKKGAVSSYETNQGKIVEVLTKKTN